MTISSACIYVRFCHSSDIFFEISYKETQKIWETKNCVGMASLSFIKSYSCAIQGSSAAEIWSGLVHFNNKFYHQSYKATVKISARHSWGQSSSIVSLLICLLWELLWKKTCMCRTVDQSHWRCYNGAKGGHGPSLLSCFSIVSLSWFTFAIVSIILLSRGPLTCLLLAMPLTNQMGYIKLTAWLPGIYGNVNSPCPQAMPLD